MSTQKKLMITIAVLMALLVASASALVVVLVASQQQAKAMLKVKYVVQDVSCIITADYAFAGSISDMTTTGLIDGDKELEFAVGENLEGSLLPVYPDGQDQITLTKENNIVVFEYKFVNTSTGKDITIEYAEGEGEDELVKENVVVGYKVSSTKLDPTTMDMTGVTSPLSNQLLSANSTGDSTMYIYIVVKIDQLLYDAEYSGAIIWKLTRANIPA